MTSPAKQTAALPRSVTGPGAARRRPGDAAGRRLERLVDLGIAGVLFVAPLFMGGRHPLGRLVLVAIVGATAVAWCLKQCAAAGARWRWSGVELLMALGLGLLILQLVPLPPPVLGRLSPAIGKILPLWTGPASCRFHLGQWQQLSLTPQATRDGLVIYLTYWLLFLVVVQRVGSLADVEQLMRWLALAAVFMAGLGLAQFLFGNGKFLWIYAHPERQTFGAVKGAFFNENHLAHFLALGIGPLIWWFQSLLGKQKRGGERRGRPAARPGSRDRQQAEQLAVAVGIGLVTFAGLLTFSRGGILVMSAAAILCVGVYVGASVLGKRSLLAILAIAIVVAGALCIYGYEPLAKQLATIRDSRSLGDLCGARKILWQSMLGGVRDFPVWGAGVGSHREVYPMYMAEHLGVEFTYGENGYLQLLLETGIAGLALMITGLAVSFGWCIGALRHGDNRRVRALAGALLAALAASVLHSFVDFVWYIPACMSLTVILAACACRLCQIAQGRQQPAPNNRAVDPTALTAARRRHAGHSERPDSAGRGTFLMPRPAWLAATMVAAVLGAALVGSCVPAARAAPHWDQYARIVLSASPLGDDPELVPTLSAPLARVLQRNPSDGRAHLHMAQLCLRRFDLEQQDSVNRMALYQIADAAVASQFSSREALDRWLSRAVGPSRRYLDKAAFHARRAAGLCPVQGEAYAYLSELVFLQGYGAEAKKALIEQAVRVRPHSAAVLLVAGREAALAGDLSGALATWKKVFHQNPVYRARIIEILAPRLPASFFLKRLEPDRAALGQLYQHYQKIGRADQAREVGRRYVSAVVREARAQSGKRAAQWWSQAFQINRFLDRPSEALGCIRQAVHCAPDDFRLRHTLATVLMQQRRFDEAVEQLRWCVRHKPEDERLRRTLVYACEQSLAQGSVRWN